MRRRALGLAVVAALVAALLPMPAGALGPVPLLHHSVTLPYSTFGDVLVNEATGHVYVTGGPSATTVAVYTYAGNLVSTIEQQTGATGMALSPDSSRLYVALQGASAVSAIDSSTLQEVGRWSTAGRSPRSLAVAAGRLWIGAWSPDTYLGGLVSVDATDFTSAVRVELERFEAAAPLVAAASNKVVVLTTSIARLRVFDVTGGTVQSAVERSADASGATDVALTPDGSTILIASSSPGTVLAFAAADLSPQMDAWWVSASRGVALSGDGKRLVSATAHGAGTFDWPVVSPRRESLPAGAVSAGGLALTSDGNTVALVTDTSAQVRTLHIYEPDPASYVSLSAQSSQARVGEPVSFSGELSAGGRALSERLLTAARTDLAGGVVDLGSVATDGDGAFAFSDATAPAGTYTYQVSFSGDDEHGATAASTSVAVVKRTVTLSPLVAQPTHPVIGTPATFSGTASQAGQPLADRELAVTSTDEAGATHQLAPTTTDADGAYSITDTPAKAGSYTYRVSSAEDETYASAAVTKDLVVSKHPVDLTLASTERIVDAGTKVRVAATMTGASGPVTLTATRVGKSPVALVTGSVADGGTLAATYTVTGNVVISASFAGTATHAAASAQRLVRAEPSVSTELRRYDRIVKRSGAPNLHVYKAGVAPVVRGRVSPAYPGEFVEVRLQSWDGTGWNSGYPYTPTIADDGTYRGVIPGYVQPGRYRIRTYLIANQYHADSALQYRYLRVDS